MSYLLFGLSLRVQRLQDDGGELRLLFLFKVSVLFKQAKTCSLDLTTVPSTNKVTRSNVDQTGNFADSCSVSEVVLLLSMSAPSAS